MLRVPLLSLLGLCLAMATHAGEPKPPWQRLLTGADAQRAAEWEKRIAELGAQAEGIRLAEELLALRTRRQGTDHWQTIDVRWHVQSMKTVAALPNEQLTGWQNVLRAAAEATRLKQEAQYVKALPLLKEQLRWCQQVLGENHPYAATFYNNVASILHAQAKYAEAGPLYQKALDINRQALGENHPTTAGNYNNFALNLNDQGKYAEAAPLFQKALDIRRMVLGEDHPATATCYENFALNLTDQGKYAEAGPLYQKALDINRKALGEEHPNTALSYNNLAFNLQDQGKYAEAGPLCQKALDINRKALGEEHPDTALSYNNLAANLGAQGKYAEAGPLYQKALDIDRKALGEAHTYTAASYGNVASNLNAQRKYAEAGPKYRQALDIKRKTLGEDHPDTALSYNNLALYLDAQGKSAEAGPLHQKALDIRRRALGDDHPHTAGSYDSVGWNLHAQGKYAEAGALFQKALDIRRRVLGEGHPDTARSYDNVGWNLNIQEKYAAALASWEAGVRSYETSRLNLAGGGLERAIFGAKQSPYESLAIALSRAHRSADAWAALEANLARGLLDELTVRRRRGLLPAEQRQRDQWLAQRSALEARVLTLVSPANRTAAESAELQRLIDQRRVLEEFLGNLAANVSHREVATLAKLQTALAANAAWIAWADDSDPYGGQQEHWGCVVRSQGEPHWERLPAAAPDGEWNKADAELPARFRAALLRSATAAEIESLAQRLYAQRLAPLSKHLAGVKRLFVVPVGLMAGIPIEALTDQYTVSYTPSGTYLAQLKDRPKARSTRLLAVGNPVFQPTKPMSPPTALPPGGLLITQVVPDGNAAKAGFQAGEVLVAYAGENLTSLEQLGQLVAAQAGAKSVAVKVWCEGQANLAGRALAPGRLGVVLDKEPARQAITARRQTDQMLAKLRRGDDYAELPGTQAEIAHLAVLFDANSVTTLTRADASEQRLDELRRTGALEQFRYLHLATHGKANNVRSFDSALLLTRPAQLPQPRVGEPYLDGRLTAAEVLEYWKLDAELVTLSACESGLGRPGGGDGLLGFAQAFLLAGSRAVCLSLWQVDDTATALLMTRFYQNLLGKREGLGRPMAKAEALREAKRWLRDLPLDQANRLRKDLPRSPKEVAGPPRETAKAVHPYSHPYYWSAFILIGDPE